MRARERDFERSVLPHAPGLLRFGLRLAGDSSQAEDLVQETLLLAWRSFGRLDTGANVRAWLYRILLNVFLQQKRRLRTALAFTVSADVARATQPSDESAEVRQAFSRLGDDQRTVLLLAVVEGFTCREISGILGVPIGTVMSRLSRAREAMRELLSTSRVLQ